MGLKNCGPLSSNSISSKNIDPMKSSGSGLTMYIVALKDSEKNKPKSDKNKCTIRKKK